MEYGGNGGMFGEDGLLGASYGRNEEPVPPEWAAAPQIPGTVVAVGKGLPPGVKAQPGTVVGVERALPQGVKPIPGTVVGIERGLPPGVKAQPGSTVVAVPLPLPRHAERPRTPLSALPMGRGGHSIDNGFPPLPRGAPMQPGGHYLNYPELNMPLPGRPIRAAPYPSDELRYGIRDGWTQWGASEAPAYKDYKSANYTRDNYVYRVYANQSIDVIRRGQKIAHITAASSPVAYEAITAELRGKRRVDPAVLLAALNAAALAANAIAQARQKPAKKGKKAKFEAGTLSVPPPDAPAAASPTGSVPTWVWVAGGGVVVLGLGFLVFGRKDEGASEPRRKAA